MASANISVLDELRLRDMLNSAIDELNYAIVEGTLNFVAGITQLYAHQRRWLREIRKHQLLFDEEMGEEERLLHDQYQANIRLTLATISEFKAAAKIFFENIPQTSTIQRERASSFLIAYCRAIDGRNPRKKFRRTLRNRTL